jgi:STE24 endopeptidase
MDEAISRAKAYSSAKQYLALCSTALSLLFFLGLILSRGSDLIAHFSYSVSQNPYIAAFLFIVIAGGLLEIVSFPISYEKSFALERRYGLLRQSFVSWIKDYFKGQVLSSVLFFVMFFIFYFLVRNFPRLWWAYAGIANFFISIVLARVFPMFIIPMFYKLSKISDTTLKDRINDLAKRAGVEILDVYNIGLGAKTSKANAAVCGIGKSKRILLSDTLLAKYSQDEIEVTLAHELSHHRHRHFWKLNFFNFIVMVFALCYIDKILLMLISFGVISSKYSIEAFPFIAAFFILYNFMVLPLVNLISRIYEKQADKDAISLTRKPAALSGLMKKLSGQNLSDPSPGFLSKIFFYSHPPASERIAFAENTKNI